MISLLINGPGLTAFLKLALVIYCVRGQIDESIKGKEETKIFRDIDRSMFYFVSDSISEFDLLTVALSDTENINNGGN